MKPLSLIDFSHPDSVAGCKTMSDADTGGFSTVSLMHVAQRLVSQPDPTPTSTTTSSGPETSSILRQAQSAQESASTDNDRPSGLQSSLWAELDADSQDSLHSQTEKSTEAEPAHARFSGTISTKLPPNRPEIMRTGYAGFRTHDRLPTIFGSSSFDLDSYSALVLRVKSDGRTYFVNIQTDSIVPTDIHQHRLFVTKPGVWETVVIELDEFVRTNHGLVVEPQGEMRRDRVRSIGLSSIDRVVGPYDLRVAGIWAVNPADDVSVLGVVKDGN